MVRHKVHLDCLDVSLFNDNEPTLSHLHLCKWVFCNLLALHREPKEMHTKPSFLCTLPVWHVRFSVLQRHMGERLFKQEQDGRRSVVDQTTFFEGCLNLESNMPVILSRALLRYSLSCCAVQYHLMLSWNVIFHVVLCQTFALHWITLPQCWAPHASVIVTIKGFNEYSGITPPPLESPENCLTATLTQWIIKSIGNIQSGQRVKKKTVWCRGRFCLCPAVSSYLLNIYISSHSGSFSETGGWWGKHDHTNVCFVLLETF